MRQRPPAVREFRLPWFSILMIAFAAIGAVTALTQDYRNSRRGEPSFVFRPPAGRAAEKAEKAPAKAPEAPFLEVVAQAMAEAGMPAGPVVEDAGGKGVPGFRVAATRPRLPALAAAFERAARARGLKVDGLKDGTRLVRRKRREEARIVFLLPAEQAAAPSLASPREKPPEPAAAKPKPAPAVPDSGPAKEAPGPAAGKAAPAFTGQVALVVDDMGNSLDVLDDLVSIGLPLDIAILPDSEHPRETAERAAAAGLEVLLHLPLESANGNGGAGYAGGLITSGMPAEEVLRTIAAGIDAVPGIRGVNNHMGSKVTTDRDMMRVILPPLRDRGLFFLDSLTSGRSVAYDEALRLGMPAARRDVFLDADGDGTRAGERLRELFQAARRHGRAIGICHPFPATLAALKSDFPLAAVYGLEIVPVSRLARR